jgi:Ca2+-binding RTX toxin-like protein
MTTVNYLTKTDLPYALNTQNLDRSAQHAIIQQLITDGLYAAGREDGQAVRVESDILLGTPQGPLFDSDSDSHPEHGVQVLEVEGKNVTVSTNSTLKVIVDDGKTAGTNTLTVTGGNSPELIVLGNSDTKVTLLDHGSDTILAGDGNDTLLANDANDSLVADEGNDSLVGGSGQDTLVGGSGQDTLVAGSGHHSLLQAGSGKTMITDTLSGGTDTLVAGAGPDTITGLQGDFFTTNASMPASGNDVYNIYGDQGKSTINLGSGHDTVNFHTTGGHDTINNGGGVDTINFTTESFSDVSSYKQLTGSQSGDYLIKFTDGQSVLLNGHAESSTKNAFVIEFNDGTTLHLKGGS